MPAHDGSEHGCEDRDAGAVIEQALALENRLQAAGGSDLAEKVDDCDRVGGRHDGPKKDAAGPVEAEAVMSQHPDDDYRQKDTDRREQADRDDAAPHLVEIERQRSFENEPGNEGEEDEVRAKGRDVHAEDQPDQDDPDSPQPGL